MQEEQTNFMKTISLYITLVICLGFVSAKSQTENYSNIQVNTIITSYTVNALNDTTFEREVVISVIDTADFQSMTAQLSVKTETGWQTVQNSNLTPDSLQLVNCYQPLCFYRRQQNIWVLYLGSYSLYSKHLIELQINSVNNNSFIFSDEF